MYWGEYVPVAERRRKAEKKVNALRKNGKVIYPIEIAGRSIAKQFWGKKWCEHLEGFSDFENRLPRGRTYVRNGSVCHLEIHPGRVDALVSGTSLYEVTVSIKKLSDTTWQGIKERCSGQIGSLLELLTGKLSNEVMELVTHPRTGLFPQKGEIKFDCSCPDGAWMCKHIAAVLYGIGARLDTQPELLFELRSVDAGELISTEFALPEAASDDNLQENELESIFGIEMETEAPAPKAQPISNNSDPLSLNGEAIRKFRASKNITVAEFADLLSVTPATVYRWEKSTQPIRFQKQMEAKVKQILARG